MGTRASPGAVMPWQCPRMQHLCRVRAPDFSIKNLPLGAIRCTFATVLFSGQPVQKTHPACRSGHLTVVYHIVRYRLCISPVPCCCVDGRQTDD